MITIKQESMADVPVLHVVRQEHDNKPLPVVIFFHGFKSAKEHNLHYGYLLAEKGFRVILPDVNYHGQRDKNITAKERELLFWDFVLEAIHEVEDIKQNLEQRQLIKDQSIGLAGTSMGAIITYGALRRYPWIKTAVSLMGSPYYHHFAKAQVAELKKKGYTFNEEEIEYKISLLREYDVTSDVTVLQERPLLIWHGEKDHVVPYQYSVNMYQQLLPLYANAKEKLVFISDPHRDHKVSRAGVIATVEWFEKNLY
ncbi:esterase [Bacillus alkalicellulosilyticus]|uniref:esterase n=1 Tax=Alkalihalobacterium alkalicellulosilyticum TaxID=1912214 RepID=UPI000997F6EC|nr:esterase [Bacillus alkalicellulosilyticus]